MTYKINNKVLLGLFLILCASFAFGQIQIGNEILGEEMFGETGTSVSINSDGSSVAVGTPYNDENGENTGLVRVYSLESGTWTQVGQDVLGEDPLRLLGVVVTLTGDGTRLGVGAYQNNGDGEFTGTVKIFDLIDDTWVQIGSEIIAEAAQDESGSFVSLSTNGNRIAVGAYGADDKGKNVGQVRIYQYENTDWVQVGEDIEGEDEGDKSGISVSMSDDGNRIALGAPFNSGNEEFSGVVRVYDFDGVNWMQLGTDIMGEGAFDYSGTVVSLSGEGDRIAVGAAHNDGNGLDAGHVRIYEFKGTDWMQLGNDLDGKNAGDFFGQALSLSSNGQFLAISAPSNSDDAHLSGQVQLYEYFGNEWVPKGLPIQGTEEGEMFGIGISLSGDGDYLAIGAPKSNANGSLSGTVKIYGFSPSFSQNLDSNQSSIYPNPADSYIIISGVERKGAAFKYSIYSSEGQLIMRGMSANNSKIDVSALESGYYFVRIDQQNFSFVKHSTF